MKKLREDILSGVYKDCDELREITIGEEMGVSRTPVREALRQLELEGLVKIIPNKGAYVTGITPKDVQDIYMIRSMLEGMCARWATEHITPEQIEQLEEIVLLSNQFDSEPFVFSELLSVCFQGLRQIKDEVSTTKCVGVWGDGSLGYLMSLLIKSLYPEKHVSVIGKHEDKLEKFAFANEVETIFSRSNRKYDVLVECVGGNGAQIAINDMIDYSFPNATLLLTGVSEVSPTINTRKILEKGLTLRGTTRSIREDFILANNFLKSDKNRRLVKVLDTKRCDVHTSIDLRNAFEEAKFSKFKTTINFLP